MKNLTKSIIEQKPTSALIGTWFSANAPNQPITRALSVGAIMINEEALLKAVLPVYHQTQKCRHDILCKELLQDESLKSYWEDEVSRAVTYIEELISDSVRIAIDEMYGGITKDEALSLISKKSLCKEEWFIAIIFENANYYGRR